MSITSFLSPSFSCQVSDFNLSKIMEDTASGSSMTANNPRWLAPEVLDGQRATFSSVS